MTPEQSARMQELIGKGFDKLSPEEMQEFIALNKSFEALVKAGRKAGHIPKATKTVGTPKIVSEMVQYLGDLFDTLLLDNIEEIKKAFAETMDAIKPEGQQGIMLPTTLGGDKSPDYFIQIRSNVASKAAKVRKTAEAKAAKVEPAEAAEVVAEAPEEVIE